MLCIVSFLNHAYMYRYLRAYTVWYTYLYVVMNDQDKSHSSHCTTYSTFCWLLPCLMVTQLLLVTTVLDVKTLVKLELLVFWIKGEFCRIICIMILWLIIISDVRTRSHGPGREVTTRPLAWKSLTPLYMYMMVHSAMCRWWCTLTIMCTWWLDQSLNMKVNFFVPFLSRFRASWLQSAAGRVHYFQTICYFVSPTSTWKIVL